MTDRAHLVLTSPEIRTKARLWCEKLPDGTRVEFSGPKRNVKTNSLLWARLTQISREVNWYGQFLSPEDWKDVFTATLKKARVVPGIDSGSFVLLGLHTSKMSKEEMSNLLDLIDAFAAERGVTFNELRSAS
jgi:hypothetical protein